MPMRHPAAGVRAILGASFAAAAFLLATPAGAAKPPGEDAWMIRMLSCEGEGAKMELYLPQSAVFGDLPGSESFGTHQMRPGKA
jgi:hypothetical protein